MFAAQEGRDDIVRLLLNNRADLKRVDSTGRSSLTWAAIWGRDSSEYLLDHLSQLSQANHFPPFLAAVTMLLDRGAPVDIVDANGWTALMYGSHYGFDGIVERLLDSGAKYLNTDRKLPSPLQLAARNGWTAVGQKLIERYPQIEQLNWADCRGWSSLIEAAANGRLDFVRLLLDKGANLMARDENGRNILHIAALRGHIDVVRFLLNLKKEMIDTVDAFGATPLLVALDQARVDVAGLLIIKGADLKRQDREGLTPAHVATLAGTVEILKVLSRSDKAILEAVDFRGRTPLLIAAGQGNLDVRSSFFSTLISDMICNIFVILAGLQVPPPRRLQASAHRSLRSQRPHAGCWWWTRLDCQVPARERARNAQSDGRKLQPGL
jgi:serine/threonine-protein phosphatase 6 regulatory ankyrin repeat subunit B